MEAADTPARTCLLVLCGLPASGKSSTARALIDTPQPFSPAVSVQVMHFDDFLHQALGEAKQATGAFTSEAWQVSYKCSGCPVDWCMQCRAIRHEVATLFKKQVQVSRQQAMAHVQRLLHASNASQHVQPDEQLDSLGSLHTAQKQLSEQLHSMQLALQDSTDTLQPASRRSCLVILDDTMHYTSMRYDCWRMARAAGAAYAQVYLDCPPDVARARNAARSSPRQRVPDQVMNRMMQVMCVPEASRTHAATSMSAAQPSSSSNSNAWEASCTFHLKVVPSQTPQQLAASVWAWLKDHWQGAVPLPVSTEELQQQRLRDQQATLANQLHQLDKRSRLHVAQCIQAAPKEHRRSLAAQLHEARQELLEQARTCVKGTRHHGHAAVAEQMAADNNVISQELSGSSTQHAPGDPVLHAEQGHKSHASAAKSGMGTEPRSTSDNHAGSARSYDVDNSVSEYVGSLVRGVDVHLATLFQQFCCTCATLAGSFPQDGSSVHEARTYGTGSK